MFFLTHQERKVLLFLGIFILIGSGLRFFKVNSVEEDFEYQSVAQVMPVNVNEASQSQLESIPGIGEVIASRVIEYRQNFGPFKGLEDLKKVKGIGDKKIKAAKDYIAF